MQLTIEDCLFVYQSYLKTLEYNCFNTVIKVKPTLRPYHLCVNIATYHTVF